MKIRNWHKTAAHAADIDVKLSVVGAVHAEGARDGVYLTFTAEDGRRLTVTLSASEWADIRMRADSLETVRRS